MNHYIDLWENAGKVGSWCTQKKDQRMYVKGNEAFLREQERIWDEVSLVPEQPPAIEVTLPSSAVPLGKRRLHDPDRPASLQPAEVNKTKPRLGLKGFKA